MNLGVAAVACVFLAYPRAVAQDVKTSVFRSSLEGRSSFKIDVHGRDPHPGVSLMHRIEDTDEEEHYGKLQWLPSGDDVLTISWNGYITSWAAATGHRNFREQPAGNIRLSDIVLVRDGSRALVVGEEGTILLIDTDTGAVERRWQDPTRSWVTTVAASLDGAWFATGNLQGDVTLWSMTETIPRTTWRAHVWPVKALSLKVSTSGTFVYSADPSGIKLWNVDTGALVRTFGDPSTGGLADPERWWFSSISFSSDQSYVIAGGYEATRIIELGNGEVRGIYGGLQMGVLASRLDEETGEVTATVRDFTLRTYDAETAEPKDMVWLPVIFLSMMTDAAVSPRGDYIALASNDPNFTRWGSFPVLKIYRYNR